MIFKSAVALTGLALLASAKTTPLNTDCLGGGEADASLIDPVQEVTKATINDGERAFAVHLIKSLFKDFNETGINQNIFVSPASIFQTLMLAFMGARGETEQELAVTLGFKQQGKVSEERSEIVKNYLFERAFQAIREKDAGQGYTLTHANKFYFDRALDLNACLQTVLQDELEALDFSNGEKARGLINGWVAEKTRNKITDLLPEGSIDASSSKVALVNAAYFKGQWQSKFEKNNSKSNNFYVRRDKIGITTFMEQKGKFNYYTSEELKAHVLELPYVGDEVSLVVILPPFEDNSLFETVSRLTPETLKGVMAEVKSGFYQVDDLTVRLPKFKVEQRMELSSTLQKLGVASLFDPATSDLSGFLAAKSSNSSNSRAEVTLQSAVHKAFVEVNEEGSEAAAATAVFGFRSARPLFHTEFIADHPFLFLIYDKATDTILFFGVFQDPKL
jgi:serpin B